MLSLVICSVNTDFLAQVKKNIQETIGVEYELLVQDNRQTGKGICEVYNHLAAQAKYPYICFLHEDVLISTQNWGRLLVNIYEQHHDIGLIGLAGARYKSRAYAGWYCNHPQIDRIHITHRTAGVDHYMKFPNDDQPMHEVVCLDGVFIVARRSIWEKVRWDDTHLKGFHVYDIDFSVRASQLCRVVVTMGIDLVHITAKGGDYGDAWMKETIQYHDRRRNELPVAVKGLVLPNAELYVAKMWLDALKTRRISWANKIKWINRQGLFKYPSIWYDVFKFLLYQPLGLKAIHQSIKKK